MRIGMILDKTFPPDPRVENEALALIDAGHRVFLFCLCYEKILHEEQINGIEVKRYPSNKLEYKLSALAYTFPFYRKMMSPKISHFLNTNRIEAIHVHDMVIAEAALKANVALQLPLVLDLHENRPEIMKSYPHFNRFPGNMLISSVVWKQKEEMLVQKADRVIVVTKEAASELEKRIDLPENKITVVPNTVASSFYKKFDIEPSILKRYQDKFVILYLGDTGLRRGLLSVIKAIGILKADTSLSQEIKLVIVGSNSSDPVLMKRVKALGLNDMVDFEGWQDISLFPSYLKAGKVGISPLHRNAHHDTTYANKLFQYMSFGLPVLVSDAIAQKNLVEEVKCGLVHRERDADEIAQKLMTLYQNPELARELGNNGKRYVQEKFCWEKVSENLKQLYLEFEKP